ncbi:MAG: hypothetical protein FWD83_01920 [Promicromonosporaceae bacterium]|nr:hypothetical protein [Promicromonosporaceae bacterium]
MTDHLDFTDALAADAEIDSLRAELLSAGLLPDLPPEYEPTEATAEAMFQRVLLAGLAETTRATARRKRARVTQSLFGLAATALVGAVVVVPMMRGGVDEADFMPTSDGGGIDEGYETSWIETDGDPYSRAAVPAGGELDTGWFETYGTIIHDGGCLLVLGDDGQLLLPVHTRSETPVMLSTDHIGARVLVSLAPGSVGSDTLIPEGCEGRTDLGAVTVLEFRP